MRKLLHNLNAIGAKLISIKDDPGRIANGYALGIFLATTPFIGLKVFIALLIASIFNWNRVAAVIGVYHVNSLTAPFFYGLSFSIGRILTGSELKFHLPQTLNFQSLVQTFIGSTDLIIILTIGGLILGIPGAFLAKEVIKRMIMRQNKTMNNQTNTDSTYALVTGASRGLGKEIARELAQRNYNLLLVSLRDEGLPELCSEIATQYGIKVHYIETDLSESSAVFQVATWALDKGRISILINNAGIGGTRAFDQASTEYIDSIIQLNIRATSLLTRLLLPELRGNKQAFILNVASMASFSPIAYKTVYPASKAFIWSFSRGLYEELKNTGVFVSVIHPGPMKTNPDVTRRIEKHKLFGKIGLVTTQKIAKVAVNNLLKHDSLIIPGFLNKLNWLMIQIVPVWIRLNLISKVILRELEEEKYAVALKSK